jgi:CheY-like chemotaxis protein
MIDARHHVLTVNVPDGSIQINGDAARLSQVLANILNNAAKFTEPGGHITLTASRLEHEVLISITDTGAGIPAEMLPKIFDLFTQVDRPLDRASTGLGIGLALVHKLVEMHGGRVTAHSAGTGKGAEIQVHLPLYDAIPAVATPQPPVSDPASHLPSRRILVVDDNKDAAETLALMLKLQGHDVKTAHDGIEALNVAPGFAPHVILLDLGMPKLNGFETANRVRGQPWGRNIALVAVTGWGQPKDRQRTVEAGFDAHLVKPVDEATLTRTLYEVAARVMSESPAAEIRPRPS